MPKNFDMLLALTITTLVSLASATIDFNITQIPDVGETQFPLLSLGAPASIPSDLLRDFVGSTSPNATFASNKETGGTFAYDGDRLAGFTDAKTGETKVFPNLGLIAPARGAAIDTSPALSFLRLSQTFPKDNTTFTFVNGSSLFGTMSKQDQPTGGSQLFMTHAVAQRNIALADGSVYPVCGPGSQASFGMGASGKVHSLSYQWKPATMTGKTVPSDSTKDVYNSILGQLKPAALDNDVRVDNVDLCFYDSGLNFIQPVYRFTATLVPAVKAAQPSRLLGYVAIGSSSPEPVPDFNDPGVDAKSAPVFALDTKLSKRVWGSGFEKRGAKPSIKVGRYVVRDDSSSWVNNANNFFSSLLSPLGLGTIGSIANFINSQYFWAEPRMFTNQKNSFINSVHLAETEVHGNWHLFTTEKNCCDVVDIETQIPADGYGGGAGGSLAYWVIHSCEVIPTPTDYSAADFHKAFDPWWKVFNGMHAVVGYRTEMWIADGAMPTFGTYLSIGAPFVSSWLQAVHDDTKHYLTNGKPQLYFDGNRGIPEPMGRPSAVVVCGHEADIVTQVQNLGRPSCLREFWYDN